MPTSARWAVANSPKSSVKNRRILRADRVVRPYMMQRPNMRRRGEDSVGLKNVANSPKITVKTVHSARSDVGIGPYRNSRTGILYSIPACFRKAFPKKVREKSPRRETPEGHLFRSIRHQASLFIFSVIWLFLRAAAFL